MEQTIQERLEAIAAQVKSGESPKFKLMTILKWLENINPAALL